MKRLLVLSLLLALPLGGRAADPQGPAPAASTAKGGGAAKGTEKGKKKKVRHGDGASTAPSKEKADSPKDEKPCEPVKPCPID